MKLLTHIIALLAGAGIFWITTTLRLVRDSDGGLSGLEVAAMDMTYSDFISILLTVVTIVLGAVGVAIAVVAAYTVNTIKEDARDVVDDAIEQRLAGVKRDIAKIAFQSGERPSVGELEAGFDPDNPDETEER